MSTIDFFEYIKGVLAPQFQNKSAKDYFKTFADVCGVETDRMLQARSDGMINEASADALGYHLTNSSLLVPDFAKEQLIRDLLEDRWDFVAKRVGSSELLLALLAIFGFPKAKIVTWTDLILAGIPSAFGGAPTIAASADPNGTMYYLRVLPTVEVSVYHLNNGPSLPLSVSVGVLAGAATITIQLQTDSLGVVQSTPVQIAKALTAAGADTYVYYSWTGTGLGRAETVSILSLPVVYHSFFYIDLYEPNVITSPILWNDNQTGATGKLWNDGWTWDGILPTPNFLSQLKALIRKYKPSTTSCRFIRVQNGMLLSSTPIGEEYEEDSNSNISGPYLFSYTTP